MYTQVALLIAVAACAPRTVHRTAPVSADDSIRPRSAALVPAIDYHEHLQSPAAARLVAEAPLPSVELPADLARLTRERSNRWNDSVALAELYTEDVALLDPTGPRWVRGRRTVAERVARYFRRASYRLTPVSWGIDGDAGHIAGYLTRGGAGHFTHVLLALQKGADGRWRIAAEALNLQGPISPGPITADELIAQFDAAGVQRAVVLSLAYWFGSAFRPAPPHEHVLVRAENDWTAAEAARFPDRLVAFCSFNPLRDYALSELARCASHPGLDGLKLHFANSGVDVRDSVHVVRLRQVFRAANANGLPIVVHLWIPDPTYGREHSEIFLNSILPEAPGVVVQIAHFAGGGGGFNDDALAVFAEAIERGDPRTRRVYFDLTGVAEGNRSAAELAKLAVRMRQIGMDRMLFGSDMAAGPAWEPWVTFRMTVPLTEREFRTIAGNVAPYIDPDSRR